MMKKQYLLAAIAIPLFIFQINAYSQCNGNQTTVILSLDGFRWDYPDKTDTPTLDLIAKEGVKAVSLIPSFPSKTFPNHYTIATGLVPDHHGIVNNSFYDPEMEKSYSMSKSDGRYNPAFYGGEPIWITAQKQGVRTASFYWVGTDVAIQGKHPDIWKMYEQSVSFEARIDSVISWLKRPYSQRPRLIMLYYHEPDGVGHDYGPEDPRTFQEIHELDSITGILYSRLKKLPEGNCINFIVVSDHGMGPTSSDRVVALDEYISKDWNVRIEGGNPNFNFYAEGKWADSVYFALKKSSHLQVWKPTEVPEYLKYGTNKRVGDVIAVADSSWSIAPTRPKRKYSGGTHGYDITNTDMHAIFYAAGPGFKKNFVHPSFKNTDIYPLLAHLLKIVPEKTDGNLDEVREMLSY